jgi:hypothetical protein
MSRVQVPVCPEGVWDGDQEWLCWKNAGHTGEHEAVDTESRTTYRWAQPLSDMSPRVAFRQWWQEPHKQMPVEEQIEAAFMAGWNAVLGMKVSKQGGADE